MNILLWVLQILLGIYNVIGGIYVITNYSQLTGEFTNSLPSNFWMAIGMLQVMASLVLLLPKSFKALIKYIPISATWLALVMIGMSLLDYKNIQFPSILLAIIPGALALFVAYGRKFLKPLQ